jgi:hypothetical protein
MVIVQPGKLALIQFQQAAPKSFREHAGYPIHRETGGLEDGAFRVGNHLMAVRIVPVAQNLLFHFGVELHGLPLFLSLGRIGQQPLLIPGVGLLYEFLDQPDGFSLGQHLGRASPGNRISGVLCLSGEGFKPSGPFQVLSVPALLGLSQRLETELDDQLADLFHKRFRHPATIVKHPVAAQQMLGSSHVIHPRCVPPKCDTGNG